MDADYIDAVGIISDPHANITALTHVVDELDHKNIKKIICLGDIVGYGSSVHSIIDIFRKGWPSKDKNTYQFLTVQGNHDKHLAQLYKGERLPGTLRWLYRVNPNAVDTLVEAVNALRRTPLTSPPRIEFLLNLPQFVQIAKGIIGIHAFQNNESDAIYTVPFWLGARYGIDNLDLMYDPRDALNNPNIFNENVYAYFEGHVHIPFAAGITREGEYKILVPHGAKGIMEKGKKSPLEKLLDKDADLGIFGMPSSSGVFSFEEPETEALDEKEASEEMTASTTYLDLKKYQRIIVNTGSVSRSKVEDEEVFGSKAQMTQLQRNFWNELISQGKGLATAFYTILRKDLIVEFHQIQYITSLYNP
jgi:hypothetical protein